jgi:hypothetical protein
MGDLAASAQFIGERLHDYRPHPNPSPQGGGAFVARSKTTIRTIRTEMLRAPSVADLPNGCPQAYQK